MDKSQLNKIDDIVNQFVSEQKPIANALIKIKKINEKINFLELDKKTLNLIGRLTYSNKRKTMILKYDGKQVGLNDKGIGICGNYGYQLLPIKSWWGKFEKNPIIDIIKDKELCFEISEKILNRHKTNFFKLVEMLRKNYNPIEKKEITIKGIQIELDNLENICFNKDGVDIYPIDISSGQQDKNDLTISHLKFISKIIENKEDILIELFKYEDTLNEHFKQLNEISELVDSILKPMTALENL